MKNTAIIIPARLKAKRFPNKPLAKINNIPMIVHVLNRAKESNIGEVFVASPDNEILQLVKKNGGNGFLTKENHSSGSDRVYEVYEKRFKNSNVDLIINLQGDMPNISPESISKLEKLMRNNKCDIGTLASKVENNKEISDPNVVKLQTFKDIKSNDFVDVKDFFRIKQDLSDEKIYHHIGIYAFTSIALTKYVKLSRSKLEVERNLEQMRAMENKLVIKTGLSNFAPLGVDTEEDLQKIIRMMN